MTNLLRTLPVGALLVALFAGTAAADTLILKEKDGTSARLEGKLIERRENEFVFEHEIGGVKVRSTFQRGHVVSVLVDVVNAPLPATHTREAAPEGRRHAPETHKGDSAIPAEYPELGSNIHNVVIVLDRSSSMLAGDRWKTGLNIVDSIVDHLPPKATFGVYIYDEEAYSVLGTNYVTKTELKRTRLRGTLEHLGVNPWDRGNIRAGLTAAYNNRPDAIYLVSSGVVAESHEETEAFVSMMARLHPKSKKFPVHVISVLGGKTADADDGTETRRGVLDAIAVGLDGVYREVLLDTVAGSTRARRGGGRPTSSKKTTGAVSGSFGGGPGGGGGGRFGGGQFDAATMAAWRARHPDAGGGQTGPSGQSNQGTQSNQGSQTTIIQGN